MKNFFILLLLPLLLGCGLKPLYQFDEAGKQRPNILQDITIDPIKGGERAGLVLANELNYAFGPRDSNLLATKGLRARISISNNNIANVTNVNQVEELIVNVHFVLYQKPSGKVLTEFTVSHNSSSAIASLSGFAQNEARKRRLDFAMSAIAQEAVKRLFIYQPPFDKESP